MRGSASYLNTRLKTNDPKMFSLASSKATFGVSTNKGSMKATTDFLCSKTQMSHQKKESNYLN